MKLKYPAVFFLFLFNAGGVYMLQAQTFYNKNSKITVASHTVLSVDGSMDNYGSLTNQGHIKVTGPWINAGIYHANSGAVTFSGASQTIPQIIHHNGQAISKMTISGGGKKVILSDITIGDEIDFREGIIETSGNATIIFRQRAMILGGSDTAHIHGMVHHKGEGRKLFPIGNGSIYLPVELLNVEDPLATIGIRAFEFDNLSLAKPASLSGISQERYWHIDVVSGGLNNSQIVLPLGDEFLLRDAGEVVVAQSAAPTEDFMSIGQSSASKQSVTSAKIVTRPFVTLATSAMENDLIVHNAVSPNGDGINDFVTILNIENYPENKFSLFSRWGDKLFEVDQYNNRDRVFEGRANLQGGRELASGTYFYVLELAGRETLRGFITVKN